MIWTQWAKVTVSFTKWENVYSFKVKDILKGILS